MLWWARCAAAAAGCAACGGAWAQSADAPLLPALVLAHEQAVDAAAEQRLPRLEVNAAPALPRPDGTDRAWAGPRLTLSLLPHSGGASSFGPTVGMSGLAPQPVAAGNLPGGASGFSAAQPAVDLGLHWRHTLDSQHRIDVMASRRMGAAPETPVSAMTQPPTYRAAVELNLKPQTKKGFVAERGSVGFQLEGGGRLMLRGKGGRPMIYYRNTFY